MRREVAMDRFTDMLQELSINTVPRIRELSVDCSVLSCFNRKVEYHLSSGNPSLTILVA
jgi:hypothetical protein